MNLGIRRALDAGASHVFLVNSDAIVPPATVGRLLAVLKAGPTARRRLAGDCVAIAA